MFLGAESALQKFNLIPEAHKCFLYRDSPFISNFILRIQKMRDFCQTYNLQHILEVKEDKTNPEKITEDDQLKLNLEDLKKKYQRDNRELYHEAIKHNHRKMSDSGKLGS